MHPLLLRSPDCKHTCRVPDVQRLGPRVEGASSSGCAGICVPECMVEAESRSEYFIQGIWNNHGGITTPQLGRIVNFPSMHVCAERDRRLPTQQEYVHIACGGRCTGRVRRGTPVDAQRAPIAAMVLLSAILRLSRCASSITLALQSN